MNATGNRAYYRGLTALELITGLAIAAIVAGIGIPALQDLAMNARRLAAVNGFIGTIALARSTAQTLGVPVALCRVDTGRRCSDHGTRWQVRAVTSSVTRDLPQTANVLRIFESQFSGSVVSNRFTFEFRPFPLRSTNGTVSFCDPRGGSNDRAIVISYTGRPRVIVPSSEQGLAACPDS